MTPDQIRDHAEQLIRSRATDIEFLSISEHLADAYPDMPEDEQDEACEQLADLIGTAKVSVEFPTTDPQE